MKEQKIMLTGETLSFDALEKITRKGYQVGISSHAYEKITRAREFVKELSECGVPVYGLSTGVGWNKDRKVFKEYYDQYNKNLLRSHMVGISPICSEEECRAILIIRLNGLLCGHTGQAPKIADYYVEFLNRQIHPVIYKRGSVGEGDIGTLSAVGLAMIGEGDVWYQGQIKPSYEVLQKEGLKPLELGPKDGLSIVSSNAQTAAFAAMAVLKIERFIKLYERVFCLALEGLNGVVDPLEASVNEVRGYEGQKDCAKHCREYLKGSYLYTPDKNWALQDPLSFRCHSAVLGAAVDALTFLKKQLLVELNTSDDNPCLLPEEGRSLGSANFEPLSWVLGVEMTTIAFSHISKMISNQIFHLSDPAFTKLPRFLSPNEATVIAYGTIQKTIGALDGENRMYASPSSMDFLSLAGGIEDHGTNAALAVDKLRKLIENLNYMMAIELMHAAQAVDYRMPITIGEETKRLYEAYRLVVTHLEEDRNLSIDIQQTIDFLETYPL